MMQPEMSVLEQRSQALRDRLQGMDDDLQRGYANRRRPGRATKVNPNLLPLLRGKAVPYRLLSDEIDPPCSPEQATPRFAIAINLIVTIPLLCVLGTVVWSLLR